MTRKAAFDEPTRLYHADMAASYVAPPTRQALGANRAP